ncbi:MAG: cytochrome c [Rhodospirillales bacterium]|nr:cytochrome c [Rhodospirillales bacterium]
MRSLRLLTLVATAVATRAAWAAGDTTDVSAGRELALNWCSECHLVVENQDRVPSDGVPTFLAIANHRSTTELGLRVFLTSPHGKMPNIMLTREQMDEIVAYILSLRAP